MAAVAGNKPFGSRFVETFRESQTLSRSPNPFQTHVDDSKPIPLPRLSEWIRADEIKGINLHTVPLSP
jgi:hypothetical protein